MSIFTKKLTREITQVRFRPTLDWFSLRSAMAHCIESHYEEWRSDDNGNIALYSPSEKEALEVFTQHITHLREGAFSTDRNIKDIAKLIKTIQEGSDLSEIRRIGFRVTNIYSCTFVFDEIVNLLERKLFIQKDQNFPQQGRSTDLAFVLDTIDEKHIKTHVQLGAVRKEECKEKFASKFDGSPELKDDNNLFFDVDISIEKPESPIDSTKLATLQERANTTLEKYLKYLQEE